MNRILMNTAMEGLHESMLEENPKIVDLYDHIQAANELAKGEE